MKKFSKLLKPNKFFKSKFCTISQTVIKKNFKFRPILHSSLFLLASASTYFGYALYDDPNLRKGDKKTSFLFFFF